MRPLEAINNLIYYTKKPAGYFIDGLRILNLLLVPGLILVGIGFHQTEEEVEIIMGLVRLALFLYILIYALKWLYDPENKQFIRDNWFEGTLIIVAFLNGVMNLFSGEHPAIMLVLEWMSWVEVSEESLVYEYICVTYLSFFFISEAVRAVSRFFQYKLKPSTTFLSSFLMLIVLGTVLLMLPAMSTQEGGMPFLDALFTATSASCVTGLIVVDTANYFTWKGQFIIMVLFQLGGLGIVSFATFFASIMRNRLGLKQQSALQSMLSSETLLDARQLLKQIIVLTLTIEAIGAVFIFYLWPKDLYFEFTGERFFFSLFHSISAFCNAGFSLFSGSLADEYLKEAYLLHIFVAGLIILGSLGFAVLTDIFSPSAIKARIKMPWKNWSLGSRVAVHTSFVLVIVGAVLIYVIEYDRQFRDLSLTESIIQSFFQSVTTRTAGFNTTDIGTLSLSTLIVIITLMFIGASPGSTGGGIKTTTAWVLAVSSIATIRAKKYVEIGKRTLPNDLINKAYSVLFYAVTYNLVCLFTLTLTDPDIPFIQLVFEQVSAFSTVGLSTGITAALSTGGQIIIILTMFIGRVGTLTLALALSRPAETTAYRYADGYVMIG